MEAGKQMITFMLPRKEGTDEFTISELLEESEIYHSRCGHAKVEIRKIPVILHRWILHCSRCDYQYAFELDVKGRADICKTAIDGEERKIKVHRKDNEWDYYPKRY
jgi:hypothetical protein